MTPTPLNLEYFILQSEPDRGNRDDFEFNLQGWLDAAGALIAAGTTPDLATVDTDIFAIKWDHGDTATNVIRAQVTLPGRFAEQIRDLKVICKVRKKDAGADENAALAMRGTVAYINPGGSARVTLTTAATALIPSTANGTAISNFVDVSVDIGARLVAEGKTINGGAVVVFKIGPNGTVGATDLDLELASVTIRGSFHSALFDKNDR